MNMNKYMQDFEYLFQLTEADRQLEIAETGADVNEPGLDQDPAEFDQSNTDNQDPNTENIADQDADYMSQQNVGNEQPEAPVDEVARKKRLFELMNDLQVFGTYFLESVKNVALDMIDSEVAAKIKKLKHDISDTVNKIKRYLLDSYVNNDYQRNLYIYVLLRTELLTEVKILRKSLLDEEN